MEICEFDFKKKIEDMTPEELEERIEKGYNYPMPKIVAMPYVGRDEEVVYIYPELTARCPMTGIQDLYTVTITYVPGQFVSELKSLKFYLMGFRDLPISHEHIASKIYREFDEAVQPQGLKVHLDTAVRGGIKTLVNCED